MADSNAAFLRAFGRDPPALADREPESEEDLAGQPVRDLATGPGCTVLPGLALTAPAVGRREPSALRLRPGDVSERAKVPKGRRSPRVKVRFGPCRARPLGGLGTRAFGRFVASAAGGAAGLGEDGQLGVCAEIADELGFADGPAASESEDGPAWRPGEVAVVPVNRLRVKELAPQLLVADFEFGPEEDQRERRRRWRPLRLYHARQRSSDGRLVNLLPEALIADKVPLEAERKRDLARILCRVPDDERRAAILLLAYSTIERYGLARGFDAIRDGDAIVVLNWSLLRLCPMATNP